MIGWDTVNWKRALSFWEQHVCIKRQQYQCLELGAGNGGLSLWLALHGNEVLCTNLKNPFHSARVVHQKYGCRSKLSYAALNACDIPYENKFDLIVFKSVLGGIGPAEGQISKTAVLTEIYKALKPGGKLLFAENLASSSLHQFLRKRYGTPDWKYLSIEETTSLFKSFNSLEYKTTGFFGCFGRTEKQKRLLGRIDGLLEFLIPESKRYILFGIATK